MPYCLPASGFFHTSMNSTSSLPAYSFFSSSRTVAIILHGIHLLAPRSSSLGSGFFSGGVVGALVVTTLASIAGLVRGRQHASVPPVVGRLVCAMASAIPNMTRRAAARLNLGFLFIKVLLLFCSLASLLKHGFDFIHGRHLAAGLHLAVHHERGCCHYA